MGCRNLTNIDIEKGVKYIKNDAFSYCSNLTNITIPSSVIEIGKDIFYESNNINKVNVGCKSYAESFIKENYDFQLNIIHDYESKVTNPTCGEKGYTTYICRMCNESYVGDYTDIAHNYQVINTIDTTCELKGKISYECSICKDAYDEEIQAKGHNFGNWITDKEATYEEEGHKYRICVNCNEHKEEKTMSMGTEFFDNR